MREHVVPRTPELLARAEPEVVQIQLELEPALHELVALLEGDVAEGELEIGVERALLDDAEPTCSREPRKLAAADAALQTQQRLGPVAHCCFAAEVTAVIVHE